MERKVQIWKPKPVHLLTDVELVECLAWNLGLSFDVIKKLFIEQIDGKAFLLMRKKDIAEMGMLDKYFQLCLLFPTAKFVDDFI